MNCSMSGHVFQADKVFENFRTGLGSYCTDSDGADLSELVLLQSSTLRVSYQNGETLTRFA